MDKNYYGEGLYYFLATFLGKPYAEDQGKKYVIPVLQPDEIKNIRT
jgi:hypothetical protein